MAQHHASPYHDVKNVPMIASPLFKVPVPVTLPYNLLSLSDDILQRRLNGFSLEHRIVKEYQRILEEETAVTEAKENAYRLYSEERQTRLNQERITRARKIAPGFLDNEDRRILTPTLATTQVRDNNNISQQDGSSNSSGHSNSVSGRVHRNTFDYSEFENNAAMEASEQTKTVQEDVVVATTTTTTTISTATSNAASTLTEYKQQEQDDEHHGAAPSTSPETKSNTSPEPAEEEVIVQAVPLSELTGLLRDACLEDEPSPRPWTGDRDTTAEKSPMPPFNATRLDFREFEQGLGPPDPWDTPVDDLTALKDVISQQMGHSSGSSANLSTQQQMASGVAQQQHPHQSPQGYPYPSSQQQQTHSSVPMPVPQSDAHGINSSYSPYPTSQAATRPGQYSSSPVPVASYVSPPKQIHHHPAGGNSNSGLSGPHPATGLTASQQHARFANASPSPPPLPPPPRGHSASPLGTSPAGGPLPGVNRPPLPARPMRPTDHGTDPSAGLSDHTTVMDRSMTPPRPPLPPPPPIPSNAVASAGPPNAGVNSVSANPVGHAHAPSPPALKPRPPKDHDMMHGIIGARKMVPIPGGFNPDMTGGGNVGAIGGSSSVVGGSAGNSVSLGEDRGSTRSPQVTAPAPPPNANMLIDQLVNMGFTRDQSRGALEKYDYDLEKATNHLLDWDD